MTDTTARFRPRVIDVDAIQWTGTNAAALTEFAGERFAETAPEDRTDDPDSTAALLETEHEAWFNLHGGDWVVRRCSVFEVLGEEEFADRYEPVPVQTSFPTVQGRCLACGWESLFLGSGGYVTCSRIDCPEPDAASTHLEQRTTEGAR